MYMKGLNGDVRLNMGRSGSVKWKCTGDRASREACSPQRGIS